MALKWPIDSQAINRPCPHGLLTKHGWGSLWNAVECILGMEDEHKRFPWAKELPVTLIKGPSTWLGSSIWPYLAFLLVILFFNSSYFIKWPEEWPFCLRSIFFPLLFPFAYLGEHIKVLKICRKPCKVALMRPAWHSFDSELLLLSWKMWGLAVFLCWTTSPNVLFCFWKKLLECCVPHLSNPGPPSINTKNP